MASTFRKKKAPTTTNTSATAASTSTTSSSSSSTSSSVLGLNGTKPWTGGITLTSTGLREFDALLLCGGQPLGTCIYLAEDRWTSLASTLIKYWCSEALSQGQHLLIPVPEPGWNDKREPRPTPAPSWNEDRDDDEGRDDYSATDTTLSSILDLLNSLPKNLHKEKEEQRVLRAEQNANSKVAEAPQVLGTLAEEGEENEEGEEESAQAEDGLTIAWQYRKSVQRERLGGVEASSKSNKSSNKSSRGANVFCHSYDLSSIFSMEPRPCEVAKIFPIHCCCSGRIKTCKGERSCAFAYYRRVVEQLESLLLSNLSDRQVVRLLLYHPDASILSIVLSLLLTHIRSTELPVVILVAVQPWTSTTGNNKKSLTVLRRCCDVVLEVQGFAGRSAETYPPPPEFRSLHGLLQTRKLNTGTASTSHGPGGGHFADATTTKRPAATMYGLKRDRRKLSIQLLHIPPEDYAQGGGSVGGGGVRSGAGRPAASGGGSNKGRETVGCGGGASSALDF